MSLVKLSYVNKEANIFEMIGKGVKGLGQIANAVIPEGAVKSALNTSVGSLAHEVKLPAVKGVAGKVIQPAKIVPKRALAINGKPVV